MESNIIDIKKRDRIRFIKYLLVTLVASFVSALALHVFVYPAQFVPLGLEAVVTMLQTVFHVNAGWFNLLLNAPLVLYAVFKLDKKYVFFTLFFTLCSSVALILLEKMQFPQYIAPNERLLASVFAGIMLGVRTGLMLRIGASTGGVDIIARIVQNKIPHVNVERIITVICCLLIFSSYFVYKDFNCILLGIVQMFISEKATTFLMKENREAIKIEVITKHPERIREDIIKNLRHSATVIDGKGMYSQEEYSVVFILLNLYQMADFLNVIKKYPDTFVYYYDIKGVVGNFRRFKDEEVK